jgi:hypothetical protein
MSDISTPGEFSRTLVVSPTSAQNNISVSNWSATNNTLWDFVLSAHSGSTTRQTEVTVTHPENSNITTSFEISQSGSGVTDTEDDEVYS